LKRAVSRVSSAGRVAGRGVRTVLSPTGVRGTAVELAWIAAHLATYPLGVAQERERRAEERFTLAGLPPVRRGLLIGDVEAAGTPILLVHGLVDNRSVFTLLRRALRRRGFGRIATMNYHVLTHDVRAAARRLGATVEAICEETGYERIHVIGHSMGGVIARYYVQRMGGDARVHTLVTLGSALRIVGPLVAPGHYQIWIWSAGVCWIAAFAIYAGAYALPLMRPRADGKPG